MAMSGTRVGSGTWASSAWRTIGARGPSTSSSTSLAAIVVIAGVAATTQAIYGNVHFDDGLLVGLPAVAGVLTGTWLQQRVPPRAVSLLFAALLVFTAVELVR